MPDALPVAEVLAQVPTVDALLAGQGDGGLAASAAGQALSGLEPLDGQDSQGGGAANGTPGPAS